MAPRSLVSVGVFSAVVVGFLVACGDARAQCPNPPASVGVLGGPVQCATSATVIWSAVAGINQYEVGRSTSPSSGTAVVVATLPSGASSWLDVSPPLNQQYFYFVRTIDSPGFGCASGIGDWSPAVPASMYQPVVAAPGLPSVSTSTCSSATLVWSTVPRATSYQVFISRTNVFADATLYATVSSASVSGPQADFGARYVWVRGVNTCGAGPTVGPVFVVPRGGVRITGLQFASPVCDRVTATTIGTNGTMTVRFIWTNPPGGGTITLGSFPAVSASYASAPLPGVSPGQAISIRAEVFDSSCGQPQQVFEANGNVGGVSSVVVPGTLGTVGSPVSIAALVGPPTPLGVTYAWQRDGVALGSDGGRITGLATPTISFSTIKVEDVGLYELVVTNTCGTGSIVVGGGVLGVRVPCRADHDQSGTLEIGDVFSFLNGWFAGCP